MRALQDPWVTIFFLCVGAASIAIFLSIAKILDRMGFNRLWALLLFVPIVNAIALWVLAFVRWPWIPGPEQRGSE